MSEVLGWAIAASVTLCLLFAAVVLVYFHPALRRRRYEREARRFLHDPRPGDRAGYEIANGAWMVGEVTLTVTPFTRRRLGFVDLETVHVTALGKTEYRTERWAAVKLTYFPPSTPLGRHLGKPETV